MAYELRKIFGKTDEPDDGVAFIEKDTPNGSSELLVDDPLLGTPDAPGAEGAARIPAPPPSETEEAARRDRVVARLLDRDLVTLAHVREAFNQWRRRGEKETLWRWVAQHPRVDREAIYAEAARIYAFREEPVSSESVESDFVKRLVEGFSAENRDELLALQLLPLRYEVDPERGVLRLIVASQDPTAPDVLRLVHRLGLEDYELRYAPESKIIPLLRALFPQRNEFLERMQEEKWAYELGASFDEGRQQLVDEEAIEAEINRSGLINLVEACLVEAVRLGASDIHVFPDAERRTEFHLRIDGELQHWHTEDKVAPEALLAVIKDRAGNVDRFEREAAQDGYIQRTVDGTLIRYRVSVLPIASANHGIKAESIVIRVLDDRKVFNDLGAIGLLPGALERFRKAIRQPYGMVIMTGPTGSGKSTTLVAALHQVIRPQINVLSIEDPVEYVIRGVRQIKLGPRISMERALRSVLRHDPDVVMVGEMRDQQTAELAVKLANTGHLTFSTLHTNDAPSAVSRLYKMGVEPFLIAYAINLVVAQRLLRTLCPTCKVPDPDPDPVLLEEVGFVPEEIERLTFYTAGHRDGCPTCNGVGYKGRQAISEALYFTRAIRHMIVKAKGDVDEDAIRKVAVEEGMLTLLASAREIVRRGLTSIDEVIRVTAVED
ncbi:MAG: GspE/PulE family protein [Bacteroidota bacterium]